MKTHDFWSQVEGCVAAGYRYGQAVYLVLYGKGLIPEGFAGSLDDPYYRVKTRSSAKRWVDTFLSENENGDLTWTPTS